MATIKWKKENGTEIETNDRKATVEYCESLGFEQVGACGTPDPESKVEDLTVDQLKEKLTEIQVDFPGDAKKAELVALLTEALKSND